MAGGSVAQAKRRSSAGHDSNGVLELGPASFQLVEKEPTREEILAELVKKTLFEHQQSGKAQDYCHSNH